MSEHDPRRGTPGASPADPAAGPAPGPDADDTAVQEPSRPVPPDPPDPAEERTAVLGAGAGSAGTVAGVGTGADDRTAALGAPAPDPTLAGGGPVGSGSGEPVGSGAWSAGAGSGSGGAGPVPPGGSVPPGGGGGSVPPGGGGGSVPPGGGPPGPPGPPYQPIRRLRRSRERKVVAGVAGGLGEYTGVDPVLFRVLFAVLSVFGGAGILLYLLGWLFLPADDEQTSPVESLLGRGSGRRPGDVLQATLLIVVGIILACVLAATDGGDLFLLVVVVAGIVLLIRNLDNRRDGGPPAPAGPPPPAYQPYQPDPYDPGRTAAMPTGSAPTATLVQPPPVLPPPVKPRKERSILGRLTLSALLVVLGVTAALDAGGAIEPQARHYFALAVGVLGLGLVVGAWRGRARGLIWLGLPLALVLVAVSTAEVSLDGGTGDRQYRPLSVAEVQDEYRVGVGNLVLDLTGLDFTERSVTTSVSAGLGNVEVRVPRDVDVEVVAKAGIGEADLFDEKGNGGSQERTVTDVGPDGVGGGELRLTLEVGVGRVEVDRETS